MAKHRQVSARAQTTKQYGLKWQLEGDRLTHSFTDASPRLACIARRFVNRGLVVDARAAQISIPRVAEAKQRRKSYLLGLAILPLLIVPLFVADEPKQVQKRASTCAIKVGEGLTPKSKVSRRVTLGGLSVLNLSCEGKRYSVTIDAKGAIVDSRYL